jgi:hypothetical protein
VIAEALPPDRLVVEIDPIYLTLSEHGRFRVSPLR